MFLILLCAHVRKGKHGNGLIDGEWCRVERLTRFFSTVIRTLNSILSEVKDPGQNQSDRKTHGQQA